MKVVRGDALEIDLVSLVERGDRGVGNLPYAISSPLLLINVGSTSICWISLDWKG